MIDVTFDDVSVTVRSVDSSGTFVSEQLAWTDVERVCFADGGLTGSDVVYLVIRGRKQTAAVPIEASGGRSFFGALVERGLFPEAVWRRALGDTSGGVHCWPPYPEETLRRKRSRIVNRTLVCILAGTALIAKSWGFAALAAVWGFIYVFEPRRLKGRSIPRGG